MAFGISKKRIRGQVGITIAFDYCEIQRLLRLLSRTAYCAGVYGWTCDFYQNVLDSGINIVTGYDTGRCGAVDLPDALHEKFNALEKRAYGMDFGELRAELKALLNETHDHFVK